MDQYFHRYNHVTKDVKLQSLPSEIFRRQMYVTFGDDKVGSELIPELGVDSLMWASDYPHSETTWPHSRETIETSAMNRLPESDSDRILYGNAAELYGIH
jgi:predicted TIM-barrel fold metal-dependent hydrolase